MIYKSIPSALLYQTIVGALCVVFIALWGPACIAMLAFLALRPLILKKVPVEDDRNMWKFFYKITIRSVVSLSITIIFAYGIFELFSHPSPIEGLWFLMIPPYFVFLQGLLGLIYLIRDKT
jgi:hypothetical protein